MQCCRRCRTPFGCVARWYIFLRPGVRGEHSGEAGAATDTLPQKTERTVCSLLSTAEQQSNSHSEHTTRTGNGEVSLNTAG